MSIFAQSNSGSKKSWTKNEVKLMLGLKLLGVKTEDIAVACGHPKLSVDYKFRALRSKYEGNEAALLKEFGVESAEELKEYAQAEIARMSGDDDSVA